MIVYDDPNTGRRMVADLETEGDCPNFEGGALLPTRPFRHYVVELSGERTYIGQNVVVTIDKDYTTVRQAT